MIDEHGQYPEDDSQASDPVALAEAEIDAAVEDILKFFYQNEPHSPGLLPGFVDIYNLRDSDVKDGDRAYFTIVALVGGANDWAAYKGYGTPYEVAKAGLKIEESIAKELFPALASRNYRR